MANQTQILNVSDEMKLNDNVQMKNVKEQEENMYSSSSDTTEELCSSSTTDACRDSMFIVQTYIAQVKRKCGIELAENFNIPRSEGAKQPQCPKEKEEAIIGALKAFQMI